MTFDSIGNRFYRYAVLAGLGLTLVFNPLGGFQLAEAAQVATVNVDKLNLRSGPGTNSTLVGQANKGEQLPVISKNGDWYQVQFGGKTVWAAGWLVKVQEVASPSGGKAAANTQVSNKVAVVTATYLNVRSGPGTSHGVAGKVQQGDRLQVLDQKGDWYKVQGGNTTGWVANWLVKVESAPAAPSPPAPSNPAPTSGGKVAVVTATTLNMRSGPGTSYSIAGKVQQGARLSVLDQKGDWYKVQGGNTTGWVANWLVKVENVPATPVAPVTPPSKPAPVPSGSQLAVINADNLNLRSGPGTSHNVAGQVSRGVRLPVISRSGDWVQVRQENGSTAWVAGWMVSVVDQPEPVQPPGGDFGWLPEPKPDQGGDTGKEPDKEYVPEAKLIDVSVTEKVDSTYINIVSDKNIDYNAFTLSNPYRYVVNLKDVQLGSIPETLRENTKLVDRVRAGVFSKDPYTLRLVVDLKQSARVKANLSSDKKALTLEISKISYSDGMQGKTIFLDAGHGGHDNGASGKNALREKDVNLDITLKVAEILRQQGANVIFSRPNDTFVDLYERTRMANEQNADIFVSIHSNANTNPAIGGTSTYYYAPSTVPGLYDQRDDRRRLAEDVQRELVGALGRRDIGVLQSNFAVLRTSIMPSILIETAFVSNAEEETLLGSQDFRQRAAESIARGVSAYFSGN